VKFQVTRIIKQTGLDLLKDEVYLLDDVIMSSFLNNSVEGKVIKWS
jgi:hypothetical protein